MIRSLPGQQSLIPDMVKFCRVCGRPLTGQTSLKRGHGRNCWKKRQREAEETVTAIVQMEPVGPELLELLNASRD